MSSAFVAVAKFQVSSILQEGFRTGADEKPFVNSIVVKMHAIYGGPENPENENYKFTRATPSGSFEMKIENPELFDSFFVGQQVYLPLIDSDRVALSTVSEALAGLKEKPVEEPSSSQVV